MYKIIGIILGVYSVILWVLVIFVWHKGYKEWKSNRANRVRTHRARVLDKRTVRGAEGLAEHLVLFEFGGRQMELAVSAETYAAVKAGDDGILHLRAGRFEQFTVKSEAERADEVYRRMVKD